MDIFGHGFSGVLIGQCLEPRARGTGEWNARDAAFWAGAGALAATMPDVDAVTYLFGAEVYAKYHQVFTHNAIALGAAPPIVAWIFHRKTGRPFPHLALVFWVGMAAHLLGDVIAYWPLRPFLPFSDRGFAFALIQRDFSLVLPILFGAGAALGYVDQVRPFRRVTAACTLAAGIAYLFSGSGL